MIQIESIAPLFDRYQGLIVDLWGVMHNGERLFAPAVAALAAARARGLGIVLLSNAPRRAATAQQTLSDKFGLDTGLYDALVTSGEATWQALTQPNGDPLYQRLQHQALYCVAPERDLGFGEGLTQRFVDSLEAAQALLVLGPDDGLQDTGPYEALLREARTRNLPLICANPDRVVVKGAREQICAGAIAERYEALGGAVHWHGKPYPPVYRSCLDLLGLPPRSVLAIGDSLRTDIAGANGAGIDSLWLASGIHAKTLAESSPEELADSSGSSPNYFAPSLMA
jgi:HAD superfamily hydrolase (TIGR01459 family)